MTIQVGVIGTGFGARVVAPVFAATEGCGVVDVVSARNDAAVVALCENPDVDLVCVHSPPFLHAAHVRRAMSEGRAVLCDKPFGRDATEAETLYAAAEAADCLHLLNFEFRYHPTRALVRDLVDGGSIGIPEHVQWTHLSAGSREPLRPHGWLFDRAAGGGWVGAWGSHAVDFLRWTFGEIGDVWAQCRTTITERRDGDGTIRVCDAEDGFSAVLGFDDGVTVAIDSTFAAPVSLAPRFVVVQDLDDPQRWACGQAHARVTEPGGLVVSQTGTLNERLRAALRALWQAFDVLGAPMDPLSGDGARLSHELDVALTSGR
jgi:predicted dehydrogenase